MARPTIKTPELLATICARLAEGESLRAICRDDGMPDRRTVVSWLVNDSEFYTQYTHARDVGLDQMADEVFDIADDGRNDWIERESQRTGQTYIALNDEAVQRSKIRIDSRKWYLSKLAPKKYGEKQILEHTGPDGKPLNSIDSAQTLAAILARAASRKIDDDISDLV